MALGDDTDLIRLLVAARAAAKDGTIDDALLGALADELQTRGDDGDALLADKLRQLPHDYEDVSYHGSPTYECAFCGAGGVRDMTGRCPEGAEGWVRKVKARLAGELKELGMILEAERRAAYLKSKYGVG